jgi:hypothetical protein
MVSMPMAKLILMQLNWRQSMPLHIKLMYGAGLIDGGKRLKAWISRLVAKPEYTAMGDEATKTADLLQKYVVLRD